MNGMKFISRNGIKALVALVGISVVGIVAQRYLAASPSKLAKVDTRPRVEVEHPRRVTVVQRLQTNATLEAFEETDLFAKVSGYLSDVRVDIGDHVKAGQVLAVISVPEMEDELAEDKAQLDSKRRSLETAERQVDHNKANVTLQDLTLKRQEGLFKGRDTPHNHATERAPTRTSPRPMWALLKRTAPLPPRRSTSPPLLWRGSRRCLPIRRSWRLSME